MARKKSGRRTKNFGEAIGIRNIWGNETTDFFLGLLLMAFAIYMVIAMVSYLSTGQADQSMLEGMRPGEWTNTNHEFTNYCGSLGALLSYFLITANFGLPSFLIPAFLLLVSLQLMRAYRMNLLKWFFGMALVMVWTSVTFAKFVTPFMSNQVYNPGGNHGLFCVQKLENLIGPPGLTAVLLIVALAFLTYLSAETIEVIRKAINPVRYITDKVKLTVTNHEHTEEHQSADDIFEVQDDGEQEGDAQSDAEVSPTVVDLTDMAQAHKEPAANVASLDPAAVNAGHSSSEPENQLVVDAVHSEDLAAGKVLAGDDRLDTPINPWEPFTKYKFPTCELLKKYNNKPVIDMDEIKANNARIVEVLNSFGVKISKINATVGPTITLYEITPAEGVRISKIRGLEADIALSLSALGIRIIAPIPGKGTIGIEVPNKNPQIVSMESVLNTKKFQTTKMSLPMALGKTITNEVFMVDLAKIPHLLVAGATGQGKSVALNAIISSLLYKKHPNELKFVLVDPKKVEFSIYNKITPHYMAALPENEDEPIITDVQKVVRTLNSLCKLMDHRYDLLKKAQVKKIDEYNDKYIHHHLRLTDGHDYMPYIVVIIDEFGDLIMTAGKEIELPIQRIAQLARAVGIHMIIATQRPTTKIITGNIKANFPGRMAFRVTSQIDSRTILDCTGADQLVGRGDMLFLAGGEPVRVQCAFIDTPEIEAVNDYIAGQPGPVDSMELPEPDDNNGGMGGAAGGTDSKSLDPFFDEAAHAIVISQQGSTSMIQRRFSIGYNRAGRLMDQLASAGIVGAAQGSKPREVLITDENSLNVLLNQIHGN
ncbi:DNA segregation ATPase, FtsK/SpoIIIE family [Prevotella dentalis DSM 3688]|uniref:DNA segregation ATPase, FtsK/SpoIIIE family n=1 Tax=Prevotella dentalis (strain ATCC 49559 / DSM 3688 / JCM 13448 / NCTC 12043 / ES 2772) TaxID=908937 RepID=F9CZS5_PREDD|nr:DNA translocase FtsK [Prevotella dentalis]AGB28012.1 DNA segregation ATPase, FtsK/SpoIIIE family [Prevotella dentalis DSM 3688]EGQ17758.1 FtsK/SpoIIIE family protein [Prevotella dentalis DSM 3688]